MCEYAGGLSAAVGGQNERVGRREKSTAEDERSSTHAAGQVQEDVRGQSVTCRQPQDTSVCTHKGLPPNV